MNKYALIGKFTTHEGKRDELLKILSQAAESMNGVKGCHLYIVYKDAADENGIWVSELWDTVEDHDASLKLPGVGEMIAKAMPLINGKPQGYKLEAVAGNVKF